MRSACCWPVLRLDHNLLLLVDLRRFQLLHDVLVEYQHVLLEIWTSSAIRGLDFGERLRLLVGFVEGLVVCILSCRLVHSFRQAPRQLASRSVDGWRLLSAQVIVLSVSDRLPFPRAEGWRLLHEGR